MENHPQQANTGLNLDSTLGQKKPGELSYANNALVEGFDGESVTYQMEQSNDHCLTFPEGTQVIGGPFNITQINRIIVFLKNSSGIDEIGYVDNEDCQYHTLIADECLDFSVDHPIHKIIVKSTNCSTQFYWTDDYNGRRYIDLDNLPWREVRLPENNYQPTLIVGEVDCNKMLVEPHFSIPSIHGVKEVVGGQLKMGVYQAAIQYANVEGEGLTSFYNVSNPFSVYKALPSDNFDLPTTKAIEYEITGLDTSGLYDYYNIAIIKTINDIPSAEKVGVAIPIKTATDRYVYTGTQQDSVRLDIRDIFLKYKYYDRAKGVYEVDGVIGWHGMTTAKEINYQQIANKITVLWETFKIPYNRFEGYTNGANTELYKGYMRDEVYPIEFVPILRKGKQENGFPIPGRAPRSYDLEIIDNKDSNSTNANECEPSVPKPRWEIYNTGTLLGYTKEYQESDKDDSCYKGSYQYGELAYWQSGRNYPNNPIIWGDLAGTPIRHHKLPDSTITHIHDNNPTGDKSFEHSIFPIGFRIEGVWEAIQASDLSQQEKDNIIGFKIVRGNRTSNSSIIAKGMFNNVGKYTYQPDSYDEDDDQTYYYPNYPFNDVRPDPYFVQRRINHHSGFRPDQMLKGFNTNDSKQRLVFYSPDTQFNQPFGINTGQIKLETITYGKSYGHFIQADDNAEYLFLNKNGYNIAFGAGIASTINGTVTYETPWNYGVGADTHPENFPTSYQAMIDLMEKIFPRTNFGYSFNSVGYYNKFYPIPNNGNKVRNIDYGRYLNSEYNNVEDGMEINNFQREHSVYLKLNDTLPFPNQYDSSIPQDNSRYNISSYTNNEDYNKFLPIFISDNGVVSDDDIRQAILDSPYGGADVINIQYTGNNTLVYYPASQRNLAPFTPGSPSRRIELFRSSTGKKLGELDLLVGRGNSSGGAYDGDFTGFLVSGNLFDITAPLKLDSSDHSGSAAVSFVYSDEPDHKEHYVWGAVPSQVYKFDRLVSQSYQSYVSTDSTEMDLVVAEVRTLLAAVTSEADLQALDIENPSGGNPDLFKIAAYYAYQVSYSRFQQTLERQYSTDKVREADICSYYGSIKQLVPDQWGDIHSYEVIETGYYTPLRDANDQPLVNYPAVFGGDTAINRHAFKIKLPFFEYNTVGEIDGADIELDKYATLTWPMFWISTRPSEIRSNIAKYIERKAKQVITNGGTLNAFQSMLAGVYAIDISFKIIKEILSNMGTRNLNLDNYYSANYYEQGIMYLFAYGIPYFFCESTVNTEMRHATNEKEGNFYPNVGGEIPDEWLQEANVPIALPEVFSYNISYSKQNKENFISHLRPDYDPAKECFYILNNVTVWSDKSSLEETRNNWLIYRPGNIYAFEKSYGQLTALDKLQNRVVLARFENKSQLYNSMVQINTSSPEGAYVGNSKLFSGTPPIDLSDSKEGSGGSQHQFLLNTEQGKIYTDSKRGQIILLQGQNQKDITTKGMEKFFRKYLPFAILQISGVNTDNYYKNIGITGVYDPLYKRAIITKKDYEPLVEGIQYNENNEFIYNGEVISLDDSNYFCDKSWTLSYSFVTESWTSFHSYQPNYYVQYATYFQSGINGTVPSLWNHNKDYSSYHTYYGTNYPYILEYPISYEAEDEILQNVRDYTVARRYANYEVYTTPDKTLYFNKAIIYNDQQCTGILNLIPASGLAAYGRYPKYNSDSKDIQISKSDSFFQWNSFWNITKSPDVPIWNKVCEFRFTNKSLNVTNLDYTRGSYTKAPMRAKNCYIRLIADEDNGVRLISKFILSPTIDSKK